jgi:hypothetical protein
MAAYDQYQYSAGLQVTDLNARMWELHNRLASLPAHRHEEISQLKGVLKREEQLLKLDMRRYLLAEVEAVRKQIAFIQKGFSYITVAPFLDRNRTPPQVYCLLDIDRIKTLENPGALPSNYYMNPYFHFSSWEEAASCYCYMFQQQYAWFRVENTLHDRNWWQKQRMPIQCRRDKYRKQKLSHSQWKELWQVLQWTSQEETIIEFDTWVPKPGIERTWYTDAMFEAELAWRLEWLISIHDETYYEKFKKYQYQGDHRFLKKEQFQELVRNWYLDRKTLDEVIGFDSHSSKHLTVWQTLQKVTKEIATEVAQQTTKIKQELQLLEQIEAHKRDYETFVNEFEEQVRQVMRELALSPVEMDSGLMQEVPTEISSSEVERRIANDISQLPNFTARIRLVSGEYTITTIKSTEMISQEALEKRKEQIRKNNLKNGHLRRATEVEEEIIQRQQSYQMEQPQRYARQVPLQEK